MLRVYIKTPIGGVWNEYAAVLRPDRSFEIGGRAFNGEADQGEITVDDPNYTLDIYHELAGHREVKITEDDSGSEKVIALGRIGPKSMERGAHPHGREVTLTIEDCNADLRGIIVNKLGRPEESGLTRVKALRLSHLHGTLSTSTFARDSTNIDIDDFVPEDDEITMPAKFYEGTTPLDIIRECAEWEGKNFFVYPQDNGDKELFYARPNDLTLHNCTLEVSDNPDQVDNSTIFGIAWIAGPALTMDPMETITGALFIHPDGERTYDNDPAAEAIYDKWEEALFVDEVPGTNADNHLAAVLTARNHEEVRRQGAIRLPGSKVHLIKQGMLLHVYRARAAAIPNVTGGSQKYRIAQVRYKWLGPHPTDDNQYLVIVTLEVPIKLGRHFGKTPGGATSSPPTPRPAPPVDPQLEDTISVIAEWHWEAAHGTLDDTDTYDSNITRHSSAHSWVGPPAGSITADHGDCGNSGEIFDAVPITAGTTVSVTIGKFRWKWGPHPLFVNFYSTTDGTGVAIETWTFEDGSGKSTNILYTNISGTHVAPVGTQSARIQFSPGLGLSVVDDVTIGTLDPADEVVNDPHSVDYLDDCPHESPHFLPSDYVECRLGLLQDEINAISASEDFGSHSSLTNLAANDHPQYQLVHSGGQETISVVAASGSTETLDLANGNVHDVTLTANCTLTLTGATAGVACSMAVLLRQGSGAPWTVTWPASVEWVGGSAPTLQTAANTWDWVALVTLNGGTTWFAQHSSGSVAADTSVPPAILLESGHAVPFTFDEILQTSDGSDFLWASE